MDRRAERTQLAWTTRPVSARAFVLFLLVAFALIINTLLEWRYQSIPTRDPGFNISDGSFLRCSGGSTVRGYPFVWWIDREVNWTNYPPLSPKTRLLPEAAQKAEYVALRSANLDPTRDAAELLFLAHPVDGSEILWGPAALNLLCALALLVAIERAYRWVRSFVASRRPKPGCCIRCGYDLTGNVSGECPECGRKVDPAMLKPPVAE